MSEHRMSKVLSRLNIRGNGRVLSIADLEGNSICSINSTTKKTTLSGNLEVQQLKFSSLAPGLNVPVKAGNSRVLEVSDISEFQTIGAALNAANNLVPPPSNGSGVVIYVYPGIYVEDNPLILPEGIVIEGRAGRAPYVVVIPTNTDIMFDMQGDSSIKNLQILGSQRATIGINSSNPGLSLTIEKGVVLGCATAMKFAGVGTSVNVLTSAVVSVPGQSITTGVHLSNGCKANLSIAGTFNNVAPNVFEAGLLIEDANSSAFVNSSRFSGLSKGVLVRNSGRMDCLSCEFRNCEIGLYSENQGQIVLNGGVFTDNTKDVHLDDDTVLFNLAGASLDRTKISFPISDKVQMAYFNTGKVEAGFDIMGKLSVGNSAHPSTAAFGGGGTYIRGMSVVTYQNSVNAYTDITPTASIPGGNSFPIFPDVLPNTCIYIGSDEKFYGLRSDITSTLSMGLGNIVFEYYNNAWTEFPVLVTAGEEPFTSYAQNIFSQIESQRIRFGRIGSDWATTAIDSKTKYWIRIRISLEITGVSNLNFIALQPSFTEINGNGFNQYYGKARPMKQIPFDINMAQPVTNSPNNQDIYLSTNLRFGNTENVFATGTLDRIALKAYLPPEIDTSFGIKIVWSWLSSDINTSVQWVVRWGYFSPDDVVYLNSAAPPLLWSNELYTTIIENSPDTVNKITTSSAIIGIENMVARQSSGLPKDILVVSLERNGALDANIGNCVVVQLAPFYHAWCNGLFELSGV